MHVFVCGEGGHSTFGGISQDYFQYIQLVQYKLCMHALILIKEDLCWLGEGNGHHFKYSVS